jgi:ribonuclease PH
MNSSPRSFGRSDTDIRPLTFEVGFTRYAEGSVLVRAGNTHVLCTATIEENVPSWLKGKGQGWITSEYSMLPRSTHTRSRRDREKVSGRTQEIQRLIGRALRSCVDLKALGERQVILDCDVLQADGGTRTTSITGACLALRIAIGKLAKEGKIPLTAFTGTVAAISIGIRDGKILTDLDYDEDSTCDVDMNFVMTEKDAFVEIQGTAEKDAFTRDQMNAMTESAIGALSKIRTIQAELIAKHG